MTVFYSHQDEPRDPTRVSRPLAASLRKRLVRPLHAFAWGVGSTLEVLHRAIITAKMRRIRRELMFGSVPGNNGSSQSDNPAKFPQMPLILGDKWDF